MFKYISTCIQDPINERYAKMNETLVLFTHALEAGTSMQWYFPFAIRMTVSFSTDGERKLLRFCNKNKVGYGSTCFSLFNKTEVPSCLLICLLLHKLFFVLH